MTDEPVEVVPDEDVTVAPPVAVVPYAPAAGEVIDLSDRPKVAATIRSILDWQDEVLRPVLDALQAALIQEADLQGAYTLRYGRLEVKVDGPDVAKVEWQDDLEPMIVELRGIGLPEERAAALATKRTTWKVNMAECNRISKNPAYKAVIDKYRTRLAKKRYATVRRGG